MSFRCQKCGVHQEDHTKPHRVVTQWYEKSLLDDDGNPYRVQRDIKKEEDWCDACFLGVEVDDV